LIPGGTFNRSNNPNYPATISDFRLDVYEVTVGRFRQFLANYPGNLPGAGSGKNPNNPADPGWDSAWNASLEMDVTALRTRLNCSFDSTWTDEPGSAEALPINCITWYEALAFCIWDGGRLATEAEWNYAAAGGSEQRELPWSNPPDSTVIDASFAVYDGAPIAAVGSKSEKGDGKWGHADLAGNVFEWVQDNIASYVTTCVDCAFLDAATTRGDRGGGWLSPVVQLETKYRGNVMPSGRQDNIGARCARAP
jgi:formylglycine-generating enzyme required for sulfatase activity